MATIGDQIDNDPRLFRKIITNGSIDDLTSATDAVQNYLNELAGSVETQGWTSVVREGIELIQRCN